MARALPKWLREGQTSRKWIANQKARARAREQHTARTSSNSQLHPTQEHLKKKKSGGGGMSLSRTHRPVAPSSHPSTPSSASTFRAQLPPKLVNSNCYFLKRLNLETLGRSFHQWYLPSSLPNILKSFIFIGFNILKYIQYQISAT